LTISQSPLTLGWRYRAARDVALATRQHLLLLQSFAQERPLSGQSAAGTSNNCQTTLPTDCSQIIVCSLRNPFTVIITIVALICRLCVITERIKAQSVTCLFARPIFGANFRVTSLMPFLQN